MELKQAKELVRSRLSDKRYEHTINVKKMAVKLAKHYGTDPEQAALAALLHDAAKELPKDEMRAIMQAYPLYAQGGEARPGMARQLRRHSGAYGVGRHRRSRAQRHRLPYRRQGGHDPAGQDPVSG